MKLNHFQLKKNIYLYRENICSSKIQLKPIQGMSGLISMSQAVPCVSQAVATASQVLKIAFRTTLVKILLH